MSSMATNSVSMRERFLFDLNGFLVIRNVLSNTEVDAANAAIDAHYSKLQQRTSTALRNTKADSPLSAEGPRQDMGGMLWWPKPDAEVFRSILTHPKLVPYYTMLCGEGYRLDHQPLLIVQDRDSEGFSLHGGPVSLDHGIQQGRFNPELQYRCFNGQLWTSLLAVSVQLSDHAPGDGGFCVVRGSHKLSLPVPSEMTHAEIPEFAEHVHQPITKKGDVVIWSEATVHGATPWRGTHQRRIALYRFAPANMGYGRGYLELPREAIEDLTPSQRAVVEPPYAVRLERPMVNEDVARDCGDQPQVKKRSKVKKDFDKALFGTNYF
eukprot:CAMPEP_0119343208 /NCGR_PEP_ID=MMETSP1333-20130426/106324_1 /TAXON_ID=418940 /ORGANISM="Scyphosphaera apsteinii, Strain RCC1455" /LENGTH=322 /DNA_ID=CAMNT_0007355589 /DNA_START=218 /DNA_END=1186 /DNA_ORIENTATION=+